MPQPATVKIKALGQQGDGIAEGPQGLLHLPFCLPGEMVSVGESENPRITSPSPQRASPICPHFTRCGGCRMQHAQDALIAEWKTGLAGKAFAHAGLSPALKFLAAHGQGRRRVSIHVRKDGDAITAGFMQAKSHSLVDVDACPLLTPALKERAFIAARALGKLLGAAFKPFDVQFAATDTGLDADMRGTGPLSEALRAKLAASLSELQLARLSLHGDVVAMASQPVLRMGKAELRLPPGGFLQATAEAETILTHAASEALSGMRKVVDLFCGAGPFALRLAETASVHAADSDAASIAALQEAHRRTGGLKPLTAEKRDLFKMPLLARELSAFEAAVIDPPRAGARAQMQELAKSPLKRIFSVGCDAGSFSRDCAILVEAGWEIGPVTVLDQFRYSPHMELMTLFTRKRK